MIDLPSAIAQEAQEYVAVRGTTLERMFLDYLKAVRRENAAVNSQNEAVRIQFEAVNFRNEAVKRTSAPCPTEKRSMTVRMPPTGSSRCRWGCRRFGQYCVAY